MKNALIAAGKLQVGGAEKVARDIALHGNHTHYVYDYIVFGDSIGEYEPQLEAMGCRIFHLPEPSRGYIRCLSSIRKIMAENHYHIVHAHTMFNCGWVMWLGKKMGIPVRIAHAHSALIDGNRFVKQVYESVMRFLILHCATDLAACGVAAGQRLFGGKAFAQRGTLILNGIDVPSFAYDAEKRKAVRGQLNAQTRFILGHAGHLAEVKNQAFLLDLMPLVLEKRPDALLLLLGEGEDRPALEEKIHEMRLEDHVVMTGNVSNVADYLSAMDVFVFPSLYEGLPLSILEVQANGLPCVISDGVPKDVFLTDLIHPLSLSEPKQRWVDLILSVCRGDTVSYNRQLQHSDYAVETAMEKIYRIYEKG